MDKNIKVVLHDYLNNQPKEYDRHYICVMIYGGVNYLYFSKEYNGFILPYNDEEGEEQYIDYDADVKYWIDPEDISKNG